MSEHDDDPLVRALRAPGSPQELAGEADAVAAFRAGAAAPGRARRALGRLGVGSSALVLSITLGGGVAAAYTQTLPAPVQDFAHGVLGPVGVPPSRAREPQRTPPTADPGPDAPAPVDPQTSPPVGSTSPEPGAETTSAAPGGGSSPTPPPGQPSPSAGPTADPTDEPTAVPEPSEPAAPTSAPTASPTAEPTAPPGPLEPTAPPSEPVVTPQPAEVSIAVSADRAGPGATVVLTGTVTDDQGAAVPDRKVHLAYRTVDGTWTVHASATSDSGGQVTFLSPALTETLRVRLALRTLVSDSVRVSLAPQVELAASERRGGRTTLTATVSGGRAGDSVEFYQQTSEGPRELGRARLADDGTASLSVPARDRRTVYAVRLPATLRHLRGDATVVLAAPGPDSPSSPPTPRVAS